MFVDQKEVNSIKPDGTGLKQVTHNTIDDSFERSID